MGKNHVQKYVNFRDIQKNAVFFCGLCVSVVNFYPDFFSTEIQRTQRFTEKILFKALKKSAN